MPLMRWILRGRARGVKAAMSKIAPASRVYLMKADTGRDPASPTVPTTESLP